MIATGTFMKQDKFLLDVPAVNVVLISATHAQRASARFGPWRAGSVDAPTTPHFLACCTTLDGQPVIVDSQGAIAPLRPDRRQANPAARPEIPAWQRDFRGWGAGSLPRRKAA